MHFNIVALVVVVVIGTKDYFVSVMLAELENSKKIRVINVLLELQSGWGCERVWVIQYPAVRKMESRAITRQTKEVLRGFFFLSPEGNVHVKSFEHKRDILGPVTKAFCKVCFVNFARNSL